MRAIDINCDMGENCGDDSAVMKFISSANIACGGHAGDRETIKKTVLLANQHNVSTGAHPGYPDKENFGRIETGLEEGQICDEVLAQIFRFKKAINSLGGKLSHIKLHGVLYNRAAGDYSLMYLLTQKINKEFGNVPFYTLVNSISEKAIADAGGVFKKEGFADRAYDDEGKLVSRKNTGAVLHDSEYIAGRVLELLKTRKIKTITGKIINMDIDTICVHGDTPGSVHMARMVNNILKENQFKIGSYNAL